MTTHTYVNHVGGRSRDRLGSQTVAVVTCACGAKETTGLKVLLPDQVLDKKFKRKGWKLDPAICPSCQRRPASTPAPKPASASAKGGEVYAVERNVKVNKSAQASEIESEIANSKAQAQVPTMKAIRAQVAMIRLLEDNFDQERGHYLNGYSDQRVADETGLSLSIVQAFRAEGYGELKMPQEVKELKDDIELLSMQVDEIARKTNEEIAKLRARVATIASAYAG